MNYAGPASARVTTLPQEDIPRWTVATAPDDSRPPTLSTPSPGPHGAYGSSWGGRAGTQTGGSDEVHPAEVRAPVGRQPSQRRHLGGAGVDASKWDAMRAPSDGF
ncbi:hypothetical protein PtA15_6A589 [Puccinia triticina]|uniref:Uncharacterized protein n=1 Tax=Puccinia triticina TaxID=208348 RepID=A0ABY7CMR6_9BASI|nr:uncharacterized protein PtA15_6A589 [Puccinia triticina]WAQ85959.1 hypothetical protein PtA15_6A589 [Puccinia triticina]